MQGIVLFLLEEKCYQENAVIYMSLRVIFPYLWVVLLVLVRGWLWDFLLCKECPSPKGEDLFT